MFFQEELASLLSGGRLFSGNVEGQKVNIFVNYGDALKRH